MCLPVCDICAGALDFTKNGVRCPACLDKYKGKTTCSAVGKVQFRYQDGRYAPGEHSTFDVFCRIPAEVPHETHIAGHSGHCTHTWE